MSCVLIRFPKHPQARLRSPLLKAVKTSSHNSVYTPIKLFYYCSIVKSICEYVQQVEYVSLFNKWKERIISTLILADIYDGEIWMTLKNLEGEKLFPDKYSLGLLLNVDCFNSFKHVEYSVGAMYLAIPNFPRQLRYRK